MTILRIYRIVLAAFFMGAILTSCSKDNKDEVANEDSKVDLSGLVITDLKIDKNTFWRREDVGGVVMNGWDEDAYIDYMGTIDSSILEIEVEQSIDFSDVRIQKIYDRNFLQQLI